MLINDKHVLTFLLHLILIIVPTTQLKVFNMANRFLPTNSAKNMLQSFLTTAGVATAQYGTFFGATLFAGEALGNYGAGMIIGLLATAAIGTAMHIGISAISETGTEKETFKPSNIAAAIAMSVISGLPVAVVSIPFMGRM